MDLLHAEYATTSALLLIRYYQHKRHECRRRSRAELYPGANRAIFLNKGIGSVQSSQHTLYAKKEWHLGLIRDTKFRPERGAMAECRLEEKESPPQLLRGYGCGCKTLPRLTL